MPLTSTEALSVLTALEGSDLFVSVDGGWGVDRRIDFHPEMTGMDRLSLDAPLQHPVKVFLRR